MAWNEAAENTLKLWITHQYQAARKAATDERYRQLLTDNPAQALREIGSEVPAGTKITVLEQSATHLYVVLPPPPGAVTYLDFEITDADLSSTARTRSAVPWDDFDIRRKKDARVGNNDGQDPGENDSDYSGDGHPKDGGTHES